MFDVTDALRALVEANGSDLHLKVPARPMMRVDGELGPIEGAAELGPADTEGALALMLDDPDKQAEFAADGEVDFSYSIEGLSRFRVNAFRQRGAVSIVCRAIPFGVFTIEQLGLPDAIRQLAEEPRGIVL